ncbi:MAG: hypothetical protein R2817_04350 [Flavobacteriales bacterium]
MRRYILSTILLAASSLSLQAQGLCAPIADRCEQHITSEYIPDGQFYRALLQGEEVAEFGMTLFGGTTYRLAACSGDSDGLLLFAVYDRDRNLLFTNKEHSAAPYWDLAISNSLEVTIEAYLDPARSGSGCAVLLVGFKK